MTFQPRSLELEGVRRRYAVYVPPGYTKDEEWPLILFLHGAGERGADGMVQTTVGIGPALLKRKNPLRAVVVFPQCPADDHWTLRARFIALAILTATLREFTVDKSRIALTGISMGGAGAWLVAAENAGLFSALAPVCGWTGNQAPFIVSQVKSLPIWVFHGDDDRIVPVAASRTVVGSLRKLNAGVRYDELKGVGHNSWDPAYQKSELLDWLIEQKR